MSDERKKTHFPFSRSGWPFSVLSRTERRNQNMWLYRVLRKDSPSTAFSRASVICETAHAMWIITCARTSHTNRIRLKIEEVSGWASSIWFSAMAVNKWEFRVKLVFVFLNMVPLLLHFSPRLCLCAFDERMECDTCTGPKTRIRRVEEGITVYKHYSYFTRTRCTRTHI